VASYLEKYNVLPSKEAVVIDLNKVNGLSSDMHETTQAKVNGLQADVLTDMVWLVDQTEKYCQDRAVYNAIMESITIIDGKTSDKDKGAIPQILSEALAVSFDNSVGHDFLQDTESRYEFYHRKEEKIAFDLDYFNKITRGGLPRKSLNVALAGTGVGKTLFMCHAAAANLTTGYNVLYITMEMSEERIAERIDANLLNVTVDELKILPKDVYEKKMDRLRSKCKGRLIVKEYPTSSAGSGNFRHLLQELKLKKKFAPDIIYIDYLNICASSRMKMGANVNSYTYIKAIAEELRGLAVEFNLPIVTATQTNRDGYNSSDVDLTNTSESFGLPATADLMFAIISTEELENIGQLMIKQLKNRYNDLGLHRSFVIGVDRAKMRLYDVEVSAQSTFKVDKPVMDNSGFGERAAEDDSMQFMSRKAGRKDFSKLQLS
jgi:archaellum biogenesis ATPase FlaH